MFSIPVITLRVNRTGWPAMKKSEINKIMKSAYARLGQFWNETMLGKHFTAAGGAEYHYKRRSTRFAARKKRQFGHETPLVFRGALRDRMSSAAGWRVSGTARSCTIYLRSPHALRHDQHDELRRVSYADGRALSAELARLLADELNKVKS